MFVVSFTFTLSFSDMFVQIDMSKLTDITQCTAHPHVDHDGTIFNIGSLYGIKTHYRFFRIRPTPGMKQCSTFGENNFFDKCIPNLLVVHYFLLIAEGLLVIEGAMSKILIINVCDIFQITNCFTTHSFFCLKIELFLFLLEWYIPIEFFMF